MKVEWIDIEDHMPDHRQWVWFIPEGKIADYYERNSFYGYPDKDDVEFGEHWRNGEVEINPDMPMLKAKWWFPFPRFKDKNK